MIDWGECVGPALLPTLLEAVEFSGKMCIPARYIRTNLFRILHGSVTGNEFDHLLFMGGQRQDPSPANDAVMIRH